MDTCSRVLFWRIQSQLYQNAKFSLTGEKPHARYIIGIDATREVSWFAGDNSDSVDVERKLLHVKAHTDENCGSNVWMLMLGKPCNEWGSVWLIRRIICIDLRLIPNNVYAFIVDKHDAPCRLYSLFSLIDESLKPMQQMHFLVHTYVYYAVSILLYSIYNILYASYKIYYMLLFISSLFHFTF